MDFTRIDSKGKDLPASAKKFQVIRAAKTGIYYATVEMPKRDSREAAEKWCAGLDLVKGWSFRLATIEETLATVDYSTFDPAVDKKAFPKAKSAWYWTATPYAPAPALRWCVGLYSGSTSGLDGYGTAFARAVRAG